MAAVAPLSTFVVQFIISNTYTIRLVNLDWIVARSHRFKVSITEILIFIVRQPRLFMSIMLSEYWSNFAHRLISLSPGHVFTY